MVDCWLGQLGLRIIGLAGGWEMAPRAEIWNVPPRKATKATKEGVDAGVCAVSAFEGLPRFPQWGRACLLRRGRPLAETIS